MIDMNILDHKSALELAYKELKILDITYLNSLNDLNEELSRELEQYICREYSKDENGNIREYVYSHEDIAFEKKLATAITLSEQEKTKKWPKWVREKKTKTKISASLECARYLKLTYNHLIGKINSIDYDKLKESNTFVNIVSKAKRISGRIAVKSGVRIALLILGYSNPASWVVAGTVIVWDLVPVRIKKRFKDKVKALTTKAIKKLEKNFEALKEKEIQFGKKIADKTLEVYEMAIEKGKKMYDAALQTARNARDYVTAKYNTFYEKIKQTLNV